MSKQKKKTKKKNKQTKNKNKKKIVRFPLSFRVQSTFENLLMLRNTTM